MFVSTFSSRLAALAALAASTTLMACQGQVREAEPADRVEFECTPGEPVPDRCNACACGNDGKSVTCTLLACEVGGGTPPPPATSNVCIQYDGGCIPGTGPGDRDAGPGYGDAGPYAADTSPSLPDGGIFAWDAHPDHWDAGPGDWDAGPGYWDAGPYAGDADHESWDAGPYAWDAGDGSWDAGPGHWDAGNGGWDADGYDWGPDHVDEDAGPYAWGEHPEDAGPHHGCRWGDQCRTPRRDNVCMVHGRAYAVGSSFPAGDGCNVCTCTAATTVVCSAMPCGW